MRGLGTGSHGGESAAEHDGKDGEQPGGCHGLDGVWFAGEEEVVLEDCREEGAGGVRPEEDAQGYKKPGAGGGHTVLLDVGDERGDRKPKGGDEERLGRVMPGADEGPKVQDEAGRD